MNRNDFYQLISNPAVVAIFEQLQDVHIIRKSLMAAQNVMDSVGMSDAALDEIQSKIEEYGFIETGYINMLEEIYHVSWHWHSVIKKHIKLNTTFDNLPEYIKAA
jgi:hypothetical protein